MKVLSYLVALSLTVAATAASIPRSAEPTKVYDTYISATTGKVPAWKCLDTHRGMDCRYNDRDLPVYVLRPDIQLQVTCKHYTGQEWWYKSVVTGWYFPGSKVKGVIQPEKNAASIDIWPDDPNNAKLQQLPDCQLIIELWMDEKMISDLPTPPGQCQRLMEEKKTGILWWKKTKLVPIANTIVLPEHARHDPILCEIYPDTACAGQLLDFKATPSATRLPDNIASKAQGMRCY